MSQPVGDLVIDLSLDAVRFDEQMSRVRRHFSGLDTDARKTASAVEQGLSRQALAAQKPGFPSGSIKRPCEPCPHSLRISPRSLPVVRIPGSSCCNRAVR